MTNDVGRESDQAVLVTERDRYTNAPERQGTFRRMRLGRAALVFAAIEIPATVATILTGVPAFLEAGTAANLGIAANPIPDFHNYRDMHPSKIPMPARFFARDAVQSSQS